MYRKISAFLVLMVLLSLAGLVSAQDAPLTRAQRAEIRFLQGMIDHHQMALDMAEHCVENASTVQVVEVCQAVIEAQTAEIELMQGWLLEWYNISYTSMSMLEMGMMDMMEMHSSSSTGGHGGHGGHGAAASSTPFTDPPMTMGMFAGFNRLIDVDYEIAWLEAMVDHHDDALHMARRILTRAVSEDLRVIAQQIIDDQTAEIELIESIIEELESQG